MLLLAYRNLFRRPIRTALTTLGLAVAVAVLGCLSAFGVGYQRALATELNGAGMQMMLVPLGCPYDAAARVLKGKGLEYSLPDTAALQAAKDPAVAVAAPMLLAAVPRVEEGRTDMWAGIDRSALALKPWWKMAAGSDWFTGEDSVILGHEAAAVEMRAPGDLLYSPETRRTFRVAGVLKPSGTSDDSLFFIPLKSAQGMFQQPGRLTAVALRLKDPVLLREATTRLQGVPGAQVVTLTEMMGAFLTLVGSVRTLLQGIVAVAITASALSVFNTLLASVVEQTAELSLMRAIGASRAQLFSLVALEAVVLTLLGSAVGVLLAAVGGPLIERVARQWVPLAPNGNLVALTSSVMLQCVGMGVAVGLMAGLYPAWRASRLAPALALRGAE